MYLTIIFILIAWIEIPPLKSIHIKCAKCAKCQIFSTFGTPNTIWPHLSDVSYLVFFATCYGRVTNLPRYGRVWHMNLLFFYSSFSLISPLVSSPLKPQPSLLFHANANANNRVWDRTWQQVGCLRHVLQQNQVPKRSGYFTIKRIRWKI